MIVISQTMTQNHFQAFIISTNRTKFILQSKSISFNEMSAITEKINYTVCFISMVTLGAVKRTVVEMSCRVSPSVTAIKQLSSAQTGRGRRSIQISNMSPGETCVCECNIRISGFY